MGIVLWLRLEGKNRRVYVNTYLIGTPSKWKTWQKGLKWFSYMLIPKKCFILYDIFT